jgi:hypothetical protein
MQIACRILTAGSLGIEANLPRAARNFRTAAKTVSQMTKLQLAFAGGTFCALKT